MKNTRKRTDSSLSKMSKKDRKIASRIMSDAVKVTRRTVKRLSEVMRTLPQGEAKEIDPRHIC